MSEDPPFSSPRPTTPPPLPENPQWHKGAPHPPAPPPAHWPPQPDPSGKGSKGLRIVLISGVAALSALLIGAVVAVVLWPRGAGESAADFFAEAPDIADPPHGLPDDPCLGVTEGQKAALSLKGGSVPSMDGPFESTSCRWSAVLPGRDGSTAPGDGQHVFVVYRLPSQGDSVANAEEDFAEAVSLSDGYESAKVLDTVEVEVGDEARLVYSAQSRGRLAYDARLHARQDNMLVEVSGTVWRDEALPKHPLESDRLERILTEIAKQALNNLG